MLNAGFVGAASRYNKQYQVFMMDVDHVYTWVNTHDENLNAIRTSLAGDEVDKDHAYRSGSARIADHGELRASLETARRYLPFVRNTYILGSGEAPDWIASAPSNLVYVPQSSIVPAQFWPNFQSNVIESFIHRIPGLSEHYLYSNDDFFFSQHHVVTDFFPTRGHTLVGLDRASAATGPSPTYRAVEENGVRALRKHVRLPGYFSDLPSLLKRPAPRARARLLRLHFQLARRGLVPINRIAHVTQPYIKSEWANFHTTFKRELDLLFSRRFRSEFGIGVNFLFHYFLNAKGKSAFYLDKQFQSLDRWQPREARERLLQRLFVDKSLKRFCLNDTPVTAEDGWEVFVAEICDRLRARDEKRSRDQK